MSGLTPLYGREGQTAGGDPKVAELLKRTVTGQYQATTAFDALATSLTTDGKTPWTAPVPTMSITHSRWLSAMLWQAATSYLDGVVNDFINESELPLDAYKECDSLCDQATAMTRRAIQLQSEMDQGTRPTNVTYEPTPYLHGEGIGYAGAWRAFEALYLQVRADLMIIEGLELPRQMKPVLQEMRKIFKPKVDVFEYLQSNWSSAISRDNRVEIVREARPLAEALFKLGQAIWAPYLIGPVYAEALRYKPTLEDLGISDPWALTDPKQKEVHSPSKDSQEELKKFWESLAEPAAVLVLQQQLQEAIQQRRIRRRTGRGYPTVPWPSQYLVRSPLTFGTRSFNTGDLIALYSSTDESGRITVEVRKTGRATSAFELLGQPS